MVMARNLDDLLDRVEAEPALYAMLAYSSPWGNAGLLHIRSDEDWSRAAFDAAGLGEQPFLCEYAGYGVLLPPNASAAVLPISTRGWCWLRRRSWPVLGALCMRRWKRPTA